MRPARPLRDLSMMAAIMSLIWEIETPVGLARAHVHPVTHGRPRATLVLGHGIGRGVDAPDLAAIAAALPDDGVEVVLMEQPWHVLGRRVGGPTTALDAAWLAVVSDLRTRGLGVRRFVVGGRSSGARVAARTVGQVRPDAYLGLAFPLHKARSMRVGPAPESRLPELVAVASAVPTVVAQGSRDSLGRPEEIAHGLAAAGVTARVVPVPFADHSFAVPVSAPGGREAALELVVTTARATALRLRQGPY